MLIKLWPLASHEERKVLAVNPSDTTRFWYSPQCCTECGDYANSFFFWSWFSQGAHFKIEGAARFRNRSAFPCRWNILKCFPTPEKNLLCGSNAAKNFNEKVCFFQTLVWLNLSGFQCTIQYSNLLYIIFAVRNDIKFTPQYLLLLYCMLITH